FQSVSSDLVVLPVTVADKHGRLMADLPRDRFVVYDDGHPQRIILFNNEDTPVSIALVIDDSGSMGSKLGEVVAAALALAKASNPDDEVFVIEFNDGVRDALGGRRVAAADAPELEAALSTLVPRGRTALNDALLAALDRLAQSSL